MDELKTETLFRFKTVDLFRHYHFRKAVSDTGVHRGQFPILKYLSDHNGCSQIEMAKKFNISPAAIAKSLNRLEKDKLISKKSDKTNKRANVIYLTSLGEEALKNSQDKFKVIDDLTFKDFTKEEIENLKLLLEKMLVNLSNETDLSKSRICDVIEKLMKEEKENVEES